MGNWKAKDSLSPLPFAAQDTGPTYMDEKPHPGSCVHEEDLGGDEEELLSAPADCEVEEMVLEKAGFTKVVA